MNKKTLLILGAVIITAGIVWSALRYYPTMFSGERRMNMSMMSGGMMGSQNTSTTSGSADDIQMGYELYSQNCASCHGASAGGQDPAKKSGGKDNNGVLIAPALDHSAHAWHHSDAVIFNYIKNGSPDKTSPMIGQGDKLSDEDIAKIMVFIKSLWTPEIREMQSKISK